MLFSPEINFLINYKIINNFKCGKFKKNILIRELQSYSTFIVNVASYSLKKAGK